MPSGSDFQESVDKTREAFRRSATDGHDELSSLRPPGPPRAEEAGRDGQSEEWGHLHPFFRGLLDTLPHPGAYWPPAKREQWLDTARNIFALIYEEMEEERPPVRLVEPPRETGHNEQRFAG